MAIECFVVDFLGLAWTLKPQASGVDRGERAEAVTNDSYNAMNLQFMPGCFHALCQIPVLSCSQEDEAPPRPPLPQLYSPEDQPPAVPPLPREATVIRHTSVRGLKRQSDERKRDRELGQYVNGDYRVSTHTPVHQHFKDMGTLNKIYFCCL